MPKFCVLTLYLCVSPFICLEKGLVSQALLSAASSLRDHAAFFQSETMRPANDPKERDPSHVRMLNDVLRDLEKSFIIPQTPPGVYRWERSYCLRVGVGRWCSVVGRLLVIGMASFPSIILLFSVLSAALQ